MRGDDGDLILTLVVGVIELGEPIAVRVGHARGEELRRRVGLEDRDEGCGGVLRGGERSEAM